MEWPENVARMGQGSLLYILRCHCLCTECEG